MYIKGKMKATRRLVDEKRKPNKMNINNKEK